MKYQEPLLEQRIELAKERANKVFHGDVGDEGDEDILFDCLRFQLALKLNKGFFDEYFDDRTLDDIVFELELHRLLSKDTVSSSSEMLQQATKEEVDDLFKDIPISADQSFIEDSKKFMETGEFK